jgi:hypothetical protein
MSEVAIAVVLVIAAAFLGLLIASRSAESEDDKLQKEAQALFPQGRVFFERLCRGCFSARVNLPERSYDLVGCYLQEEGGDGFLHVFQSEESGKREILKISLSAARTHWDLLRLAMHKVSSLEEKPNQP